MGRPTPHALWRCECSLPVHRRAAPGSQWVTMVDLTFGPPVVAVIETAAAFQALAAVSIQTVGIPKPPSFYE